MAYSGSEYEMLSMPQRVCECKFNVKPMFISPTLMNGSQRIIRLARPMQSARK